ncbi:Kef-type K+ transport system membrane component KefB [Desulfohalotomaculum tongense]|uniref:cation:proton antiporter n=1 Tax=Desulforadius tongensis TaxID=1216062 RepID=UPI00195C991D|nr:cation:proton antiporter [Desulforadius tongensis]MBM7855728.1 Kef-type K+ transport system membrane component KefB [Desulforadius tongensis]
MLIFNIGLIIFAGYIFGEAATRVKLPRITGYILAGIFLNLDIFNTLFKNFADQTAIVTDISLSFITFSVGGTLLYSKVKELGKGILSIAFFESLFAFLTILIGFIAITPFFIPIENATWPAVFIPLSILMGSLGSPTDPSAALAVKHEYNARGQVSSTIMGAAAFDDVFGIINFSIATALAQMFVQANSVSAASSSILEPVTAISGAIIVGLAYGLLFNLITVLEKRETEGVLIVVVLGLVLMCFGTAAKFHFDELLSTMVMGAAVVNYNVLRDKIFKLLERYIEELIFVLFFVISSMQLDFAVLKNTSALVASFVIFRITGKFLGTRFGAAIARSPQRVKKYTVGGLIPQGGIVIGLALIIRQNPAFDNISDIILNVIIGATVIHELIGPIFAKTSLKRAGEIK